MQQVHCPGLPEPEAGGHGIFAYLLSQVGTVGKDGYGQGYTRRVMCRSICEFYLGHVLDFLLGPEQE
jgi:hypothetical protein